MARNDRAGFGSYMYVRNAINTFTKRIMIRISKNNLELGYVQQKFEEMLSRLRKTDSATSKISTFWPEG